MTQYPLRQNAENDLHAYSGRPLSDITSSAIDDEQLSADDLRIHADALRQQAQIAEQAGYTQLAENLLRAAELTRVPDEEVLRIYDMLRPDRSSQDDLSKLADYLETTYDAVVTAQFIREAADVYKKRQLVRR